MSTDKKKLIEVALPLEAINRASAREKSIRSGHPSTIHLWWARRPLAASRAVLFASLVDDPSSHPEEFPTEEAQEHERQRLFKILEELVLWENSTNERVLHAAHAEILRSTAGLLPRIHDPFAGGGSIPLEAQRLGLIASASDLNPVPVLITKALIEIPPQFAGQPPANPDAKRAIARASWKGSAGLADDVRYYGRLLHADAEQKLGELYPGVQLPESLGGGRAPVIAWLWARLVRCPNPSCGARMPLVRSFSLGRKQSRESWVHVDIDRRATPPSIRFNVRHGSGAPPGTVTRKGARCIACSSHVPLDYIRAEGRSGRIEYEMMAVVAEGKRQRTYLTPDEEQLAAAKAARPVWAPETELPEQALGFRVQNYGMKRHADLFTARQLTTLSTLVDLLPKIHMRVANDFAATRLNAAPDESTRYANAIVTYLALSVSRLAMTGNSLVRWNPVGEKAQHAFGRQAISMLWDFAEVNFFGSATGSIDAAVELTADPLQHLGRGPQGVVVQHDARNVTLSNKHVIVTDPPYYDNVPYADLSDFFYVWLRPALQNVYPELFATLLTPKAEELIADPFRHGSRDASRAYFEGGFRDVFANFATIHDVNFPLPVFYAFKQTEDTEDEHEPEGAEEMSAALSSTGWETMLEGLVSSGFAVRATWPIRTEMPSRLRGQSSNALASSVVLACRPRPSDAGNATRRQLLSELQRELPAALRALQHGNIAPVDLAQAAIGPGMAVFSRYDHVFESDGTPMRVRTALALINQAISESLAEQEGELDADSRWAVTWFDEHGFSEGPFGKAEVLATAKVTSVAGLAEAGIILAARGKVRLLRREELLGGWDPVGDNRRTVWEAAHYLIRALDEGGETRAAALLARLGASGEQARDLAYRLFVSCERRGWAQDAQAYNSLVIVWSELSLLAANTDPLVPPAQAQASLQL